MNINKKYTIKTISYELSIHLLYDISLPSPAQIRIILEVFWVILKINPSLKIFLTNTKKIMLRKNHLCTYGKRFVDMVKSFQRWNSHIFFSSQ